jgi:histidine ammonia-lyase
MKTNLSQVMTAAAALAVSQVQAFWGTAHLIGKICYLNFYSKRACFANRILSRKTSLSIP